jgi:hypothetical protein
MEMAMNRIEIEVLSSQAALAAFTRAWRQARAVRRNRHPGRLAQGRVNHSLAQRGSQTARTDPNEPARSHRMRGDHR